MRRIIQGFAIGWFLGLLMFVVQAVQGSSGPKLVITFDAGDCILSWNGPAGEKYSIDLHEGVMSKGDEKKEFSLAEQVRMHEIYQVVLIQYVLDSEKWFVDPEKWKREHMTDPVKKALFFEGVGNDSYNLLVR